MPTFPHPQVPFLFPTFGGFSLFPERPSTPTFSVSFIIKFSPRKLVGEKLIHTRVEMSNGLIFPLIDNTQSSWLKDLWAELCPHQIHVLES